MKKKILTSVISLILVFLIFSGCTDKNVKEENPEISISTTSLDFNKGVTSGSFTIKNVGEGKLSWEIEDNIPLWISLSPMVGSLSNNEESNITVIIDREIMDPGAYSQDVSISSNGGSEILLIKAQVELNLDAETTLYVGGEDPTDYSSIQDAIDNASDGFNVFVYSGLYNEQLVLNKKISLIGESKETTIIEYKQTDNQFMTAIISIEADNCSLKGFKIITYDDTILSNGISVKSSNNSILGNNFLNITSAIAIELGSKNNHVKGNIITICNYGIRTWGRNEKNIINKNEISSAKYAGILIQSSENDKVFENRVYNVDAAGIRIYGSKYTHVYRNLVYDNKDGILICCGSNNNYVYLNTLKRNREYNGEDNSHNINNWDYEGSGNYWDDYTGLDENGDGIGDTSYKIPGDGNRDSYPLINPP